MSFSLWDLSGDLAVARGAQNANVSPEEADAFEASFLRRRIASASSVFALAIAVFLGGWSNSGVIGVGFAVLAIAGLWIYAERPARVGRLFRRLFRR